MPLSSAVQLFDHLTKELNEMVYGVSTDEAV